MKSQCSRPSAPCAHDDRAAPTMACSPRAGPMAGPLTLCPAPLAACGCVVPTPARSPKPYAHPFPSRSPVWQPRSPLSSDTRRNEHAPPSFSIACPELPASHIFSHRLQPSLPLRSRHRHAFTRGVPQPSIASHPAYPPSAPRFPHESSVVSAPHHGGTPDALRLAPCTFLIVLPHRDRHVFSARYQSNAETGGYQSANAIVRVMQASFPLLPPCPTSAVI